MTLGFVGLTLLDVRLAATCCSSASCLRDRRRHGHARCCRCCWRCSTAWTASRLGIATSLNQFSRSIGAAIGVAVMGAILARGVAGRAAAGRRKRPPSVDGAVARAPPAVRRRPAPRVRRRRASCRSRASSRTLFLPRVDFSRVHGHGRRAAASRRRWRASSQERAGRRRVARSSGSQPLSRLPARAALHDESQPGIAAATAFIRELPRAGSDRCTVLRRGLRILGTRGSQDRRTSTGSIVALACSAALCITSQQPRPGAGRRRRTPTAERRSGA